MIENLVIVLILPEANKISATRLEPSGGNVFEKLIEAFKCCSLGQITNALFEVGGQYSRNM